MQGRTLVEFTDAQMGSHFGDILLGGIDTSYTALCSAIFFVINTPRAHQKLVQEVRETFGSLDDIGGKALADGMPYLSAVISEALRLYPPIPVGLPRRSPGFYIGGMYIPEGVIIFIF